MWLRMMYVIDQELIFVEPQSWEASIGELWCCLNDSVVYSSWDVHLIVYLLKYKHKC